MKIWSLQFKQLQLQFKQLQVNPILSRVKVNSTIWRRPNVWVFIPQVVEHCIVNVEAMGSNPVEVPKFSSGLFAIAYYHCNDHIFI